jgi:hypothetical protein
LKFDAIPVKVPEPFLRLQPNEALLGDVISTMIPFFRIMTPCRWASDTAAKATKLALY